MEVGEEPLAVPGEQVCVWGWSVGEGQVPVEAARIHILAPSPHPSFWPPCPPAGLWPDANNEAQLHRMHASGHAGKTPWPVQEGEPDEFHSTGSPMGHAAPASPLMPRELGAHEALGRRKARAGRALSSP